MFMFRMLERIGFFVNGYLDSVIIYIIDLSAIIFRWQVLRHFTHGIKTKSPVTSILFKTSYNDNHETLAYDADYFHDFELQSF